MCGVQEPGCGGSWFVVLPDHPAAAAAVDRLAFTDRLDHPGGRPWIVGSWAPNELTWGAAGPNRVALLGYHAQTPETMTGIVRRCRRVGDLDVFAAGLHGSWHLVAVLDNVMRVQGSVSRVRRVFSTTVEDGVVLASDRSDILAAVLGVSADLERLALHLVDPVLPHPLDGLTPWPQVVELPGHSYLRISPNGRAMPIRWWNPPAADLPLQEGAAVLRSAMEGSVRARTRHLGVVSTDLGGVDSTSLCCLLARQGGEVHACTVANHDPHDDDLVFARQTVAQLSGVHHDVLEPDTFPLYFERLVDLRSDPEEPSRTTVETARWQAIFAWATSRGSHHHFGGFGGDEVLGGRLAWIRAYLRTDPILAIRTLRLARAHNRWPWPATAISLLDPCSYRSWLAEQAAQLERREHRRAPQLGWGGFSTISAWATPEAKAAVRSLIERHARQAEPLSEIHGMHVDLASIRGGSGVFRQIARIAARQGLTLHAPFYDDSVLRAGLSIRPQDRVTRVAYKPVLAAAMEGIVPPPALHRNTKGEGSTAEEQGLRRHRKELLEFLEQSHAAEAGLIDHGAMLRECTTPTSSSDDLSRSLYPVIGIELWLRRAEIRHQLLVG